MILMFKHKCLNWSSAWEDHRALQKSVSSTFNHIVSSLVHSYCFSRSSGSLPNSRCRDLPLPVRRSSREKRFVFANFTPQEISRTINQTPAIQMVSAESSDVSTCVCSVNVQYTVYICTVNGVCRVNAQRRISIGAVDIGCCLCQLLHLLLHVCTCRLYR